MKADTKGVTKHAEPTFPAVTFLLCTLVSVNSATPWQFPSWEKAEGSGGSTGLLFWVTVLA